MTKIKLSNKTKITNGFNRAVHFYPNNDNLIIKVRLTDGINKKKRPVKSWIYKRFPNAIYRSYFSEIYHDLNTQVKAASLGITSPIAPTRGLVDTTLGLGMVIERIGPHGSSAIELGPTLTKLFADGNLTNSKIKLLNEFAQSLFILKVVCADVNPDNIVWSQANKRFYIVDGFGDRNLIKFKTYFNFVRIKRLNRELLRTAGILNLKWSTETNEFSKK